MLAAALGAVAVPMGIAVAGAAPAPADPGLCVSGPYGYAQACVEAPGWHDDWYDGPRWRGGWHDGDGDDQGEDD
ncbi:hypothetical protein ACWDTP_23580 [Mycobacterium sp. NPDC003449]